MSEAADIARLFREARELAERGDKAALATIVRTRGSTPRKVGAKMLVLEDGLLMGSIGGGCGEADVFQEALQVIEKGQSTLMHVELLADESEESGDVCGGIMDVFIEPVGFSLINRS